MEAQKHNISNGVNNFKQNGLTQLTTKGFGLIEIILVVAVGAGIFLSIEQYLSLSLRATAQNITRVEAMYLAESSLEQARAIRDASWASVSGLTPGANYYFAADASSPQKWAAQSGTKNIGKYTVWITTSQAQRDANDNIVSSGGAIDANTLKITSNVSWTESGAAKQITLSAYLANLY
ncbi:hypothetical protein KJ695_02735 [Patescibacteria group bacterium]|nr:hypothetical protein [Patescibacteria group bacterium]MBU4368599.1 hypothetical protein [Patescibacteria group bacterium]